MDYDRRNDPFELWLRARADSDGNPWGVLKHESLLREAFDAGADEMAARLKRTLRLPDDNQPV